METVWIRHSKLPGQTSEVPVQAYRDHWERCGWESFVPEPTPNPVAEDDTEDKTVPDEESEEQPTAAKPPRRRVTKGSDE